MNWYLMVLKKYAVVEGRSRRKEYWYFVFFNFIIMLVLGFLDYFLFPPLPEQRFGILLMLYSLAVFVPAITVQIRRLHDIGKTGWWLLLSLLPIIGTIILLVLYCTDSEPGTNQYGRNPKI